MPVHDGLLVVLSGGDVTAARTYAFVRPLPPATTAAIGNIILRGCREPDDPGGYRTTFTLASA